MPAGRELDALIAEKVMGFRWYRWSPRMDADALPDLRGHRFLKPPAVVDAFVAAGWHEAPFVVADTSDPVWMGDNTEVPHYSTDIAAAWAVGEYAAKTLPAPLQLVCYSYARTYAKFPKHESDFLDDEGWSEANGEHATPHAICLAALAVFGVP